MSFESKIRQLRIEKGLTQEKLAEYLNISFQAISKWENGTSLPDIKLLKPLSSLFHVSIDYLLDNEESIEEDYVSNILVEYKILSNQGKVTEAISLMREGLKNYPSNYTMMLKLVQSLITITKSTHESDMERNATEALKLCEIIINDSNDYGLIDGAIRSKFYAYCDLKKYDKAIEIANQRPSMWHSKEVLLTSAYKGDEANKHHQKIILQLMDMLQMYTFSLTYKRYGSDRYSVNDKIDITKASINLVETVLNDGNYLFYSNRLRRLYTFLGIYFAEIGNEEEMFSALEKSKELALYFDSLSSPRMYTSLFTDTIEFIPEETSKNAEWDEFYVFRNRLERKEFDFFRNKERFTRLFDKTVL